MTQTTKTLFVIISYFIADTTNSIKCSAQNFYSSVVATCSQLGMWRSSWKFAFVECEFWCTNPYECECEYWKKKLKYDTINTDNMMQSTNITSNDCQCECKIEI